MADLSVWPGKCAEAIAQAIQCPQTPATGEPVQLVLYWETVTDQLNHRCTFSILTPEMLLNIDP